MNIRTATKRCYRAASAFMVFAFCLISSYQAWAEVTSLITRETATPQKLKLVIDKSTVIESAKPIKRVSVGNPLIANVQVLTPMQVYVIGISAGMTNLTLWGENNKVSAIFDLGVSPDVSRLKEDIYKIFPEEKNIEVTSSQYNIIISGTVSSTTNLSRVLALAESYLYSKEIKTNSSTEVEAQKEKKKEGEQIEIKIQPPKVINLLEVSGVHQVMLEVRVAEMSRTLTKRLGFNVNWISDSGRTFGVSTLNSLSQVSQVSGFPVEKLFKFSEGGNIILPKEGFPADSLPLSSNVNALFRFLGGGGSWSAFVDALREDGLVKVLAEPTLIALSGQTAHFLAGGEFPIPIPQDFGRVTIDYKPFGVGLNFTPTVLSNGKIGMKVAPEVSELDFSRAVVFAGFVIPSLTTRRVSTVIELGDGQSFAIAGLLKDDLRETVTKYPILGDLPVLGALFRSSSFQKNETELIIIVTPHLAKPVDMAKQTLPTDQYIEPDDFEFYLLGNLEGKGKAPSPGTPSPAPHYRKEGGAEGEFGHIVPK